MFYCTRSEENILLIHNFHQPYLSFIITEEIPFKGIPTASQIKKYMMLNRVMSYDPDPALTRLLLRWFGSLNPHIHVHIPSCQAAVWAGVQRRRGLPARGTPLQNTGCECAPDPFGFQWVDLIQLTTVGCWHSLCDEVLHTKFFSRRFWMYIYKKEMYSVQKSPHCMGETWGWADARVGANSLLSSSRSISCQVAGH